MRTRRPPDAAPTLARASTPPDPTIGSVDLRDERPAQVPAPAEGTVGRRRRLVTAVAISSVGDGLAAVGLPLLALTLTHSPVLVAGVALASRLPWLLVALPAGAVVDRLDRRRLVVVVDLLRALVVAAVAGVALGGTGAAIGLPVLYVAAFGLGTGETIVATAVQASVPDIAGCDDLAGLNGRLNAVQTGGEQFAGPALGGIVYSLATSLPFVGDAVSYVASAWLLRAAVASRPAVAPDAAGMPARRARAELAGGPRADRRGVWTEVGQGMRWLIAHRPLRLLAVTVTTFAFCQAMVVAVLVLYATRTLGLGARGYGLLLAVAAIGDVTASLAAGRVHARLGGPRTVVLAGVVAAVGYLLLGAFAAVPLAAGALGLEAAASSVGNVATLSARHRLIPAECFGLVNNAFRTSVTGCIPLGALTGGLVAARFGLRPTFVAAGLLQLTVVAVAARPLRALDAGAAPAPTEARAANG